MGGIERSRRSRRSCDRRYSILILTSEASIESETDGSPQASDYILKPVEPPPERAGQGTPGASAARSNA